jgi:hypothetical protein
MSAPVRLHFSKLRAPLNMTSRQASAARTRGESLSVEAARGEHHGQGEGGPRSQVTGETRASCRQWPGTWQQTIPSECTRLDALQTGIAVHAGDIDAAGSAGAGRAAPILGRARQRGDLDDALPHRQVPHPRPHRFQGEAGRRPRGRPLDARRAGRDGDRGPGAGRLLRVVRPDPQRGRGVRVRLPGDGVSRQRIAAGRVRPGAGRRRGPRGRRHREQPARRRHAQTRLRRSDHGGRRVRAGLLPST